MFLSLHSSTPLLVESFLVHFSLQLGKYKANEERGLEVYCVTPTSRWKHVFFVENEKLPLRKNLKLAGHLFNLAKFLILTLGSLSTTT